MKIYYGTVNHFHGWKLDAKWHWINNQVGLYARKLMNRITSGVHRTGGQFYYLYPEYVCPGRLVLYWYPVYADERQRQTTGRRPAGQQGARWWGHSAAPTQKSLGQTLYLMSSYSYNLIIINGHFVFQKIARIQVVRQRTRFQLTSWTN